MLKALVAMWCLFLSLSVIASQENRLTAQSDPPLQVVGMGEPDIVPVMADPENKVIQPWPEGLVTVFAKDGEGNPPKDLNNLSDGNLSSYTMFGKLQDSVVTLDFKDKIRIENLAIVQGGWGNWAHPWKLKVTVNGKESFTAYLRYKPVLPKQSRPDAVQFIKIGRDVSKLEIKVEAVCGKNRMRWGGFSDIGIGKYGPVKIEFNSDPLDKKQTALELELDSPVTASLPVKAEIAGVGLIYSAPNLNIVPGRNKYIIGLDTWKQGKNYQLDYSPCHIRNITLGNPGMNHPITLRSVTRIPAGKSGDDWFALPPFAPPTKEFNGRLWTEGLSYSSAGRFANSTYNGLLNDTVGDSWFQAYTATFVYSQRQRRQKFDFWMGENKPVYQLDSGTPWSLTCSGKNDNDKISISWTHMTRELNLGNHENATYRLSSLMPGFLISANREITLSSRGGGSIPKRSGAPNEDESRFFKAEVAGDKISRLGPNMIITSDNIYTNPGEIKLSSLKEPWLVAVWGGINPVTFWNDEAMGVLLTIEEGTVKWTSAGIVIPKGTCGISTAFHGLFNNNWDEKKVRDRASLLSRMLRTYPLECKEWYVVNKNTVEIRNEFQYFRWGDKAWQMDDYAPIPPLFAWGARSADWGKFPSGIQGELITPVGPYTWIKGKTLEYSLPRFPIRHAAFPKVPEGKDVYAQISKQIIAAPNPEETTYIAFGWLTTNPPLHWPLGILGASFLETPARERLLTVGKKALERTFSPADWLPRKELFSGKPYVVSGWIDGSVSPAMFGDGNSSLGTTFYALYCYAKYSGDWNFVRRNWDKSMDILRYAEVINDWAVPTTSAREGVLFGGIDMDSIAFVGLCAAERMAEVIGKTDDLNRIAYLRAKVAPETALRFNMMRYFDPEIKYPGNWINGFSESGPNFDGSSWSNGVSLDHIACSYCWEGEQPEMFQFYNAALSEKYMTWMQTELMDKYFLGPDYKGWVKMPFNYCRTATHLTARAWLKDWPQQDLETKYNVYLNYYKDAIDMYSSGFFNAYFGRKDRIFLIDWEPAKLGTVEYDRPSKTLRCELSCKTPFPLRLHSPLKIKQLKVDGNSVVVPTVLEEEKGIFLLTIPVCSKSVTIIFE